MSSFNSPVTNEKTSLAGYISGGRLSHAILVESAENGLQYAKEIAKAILCSDDVKPCGKCRDCVKAEKGIHPDLLVFSGGERTRSFHVDLVREIRGQAHIRPNEAESKVFILENAHNMTAQAQNALLKIIEEPPRGVSFILTCDNKSALLETVRSRVSTFSPDMAEDSGNTANDAELLEKASGIVKELVSGSELAAMAAFSAYERDRAGFELILEAVRIEAANELSELVRKGGKAHGETGVKLMNIVEIADELKTGLHQNVGGLLMTAMLPAKLKRRLK